MLNVIHCITTISRGGAENQLLILVREQVKNGRNVSVIFLKGDPELRSEFVKVGANVIEFLASKNFLRQIIILKKYLRHKRVIIHAHLPRAELVASLACGNNKLIVSRHNTEQFFPKAPKILSRNLSIFVTHRAAKCIAISEAVKEFLISEREVFTKEKISVVYYGFDSKNVIVSVKKQNKINFTIGNIGRLVAQKDQKTLLLAFAELLQYYSLSKLIIIGNGELKSDLHKLARELCIDESIVWIDKTSDIKKYMGKMDLFVLTSKYEGFGMVLLEAIQNNLPILASNNSAIPEVLGTEYIGLFETSNHLDLLSKMLKYCRSPQQFDTSGFYKKAILKFDPIKMSNSLDRIYSKLE
jgi:glycosyltransferase involved in cell wall biosynthesis